MEIMRSLFAALMLVITGLSYASQPPECALSVHKVDAKGSVREEPSIAKRHIASVELKRIDKATGNKLWLVSLTDEGAEINQELTGNSIGEFLVILCDGRPVAKARVMEPINQTFIFTTQGEEALNDNTS